MTTITIILFIISFALLNFSLISIFYHNKFTNDTTYFILSNSIILVSILLFYHYFPFYLLSFTAYPIKHHYYTIVLTENQYIYVFLTVNFCRKMNISQFIYNFIYYIFYNHNYKL